jgi:L-amino acid N-acyltransferase YncA
MAPCDIRLATPADLAAINDIYNHYVAMSTTTYALEPTSLADRERWLVGRQPIHPAIVAVRDGEVVGWGSLSSFRAWGGYRSSVENSVYVHPERHRQGIGSALLADLIARAKKLGLHAIIAGIDSEQTASLELHRKFGFFQVAHFREVGRKFDQWRDVLFLQLLLND